MPDEAEDEEAEEPRKADETREVEEAKAADEAHPLPPNGRGGGTVARRSPGGYMLPPGTPFCPPRFPVPEKANPAHPLPPYCVQRVDGVLSL